MRRKLLGVFTIVTLVSLGVVVTTTGCRKEGPAERLGKAMDQTASDLSDSAEEAADAARKAAEDASRAVKRGADDARDAVHDALD